MSRKSRRRKLLEKKWKRRRKIKNVLKTIESLKNKRNDKKGFAREDIASRAFTLLEEQGYIVSHRMTRRRSPEDRKGIDGFFKTHDSAERSFQVKGSLTGLIRHLDRHADIPCIVVYDNATPDRVAEQIIKTFGLALPDAHE